MNKYTIYKCLLVNSREKSPSEYTRYNTIPHTFIGKLEISKFIQYIEFNDIAYTNNYDRNKEFIEFDYYKHYPNPFYKKNVNKIFIEPFTYEILNNDNILYYRKSGDYDDRFYFIEKINFMIILRYKNKLYPCFIDDISHIILYTDNIGTFDILWKKLKTELHNNFPLYFVENEMHIIRFRRLNLYYQYDTKIKKESTINIKVSKYQEIELDTKPGVKYKYTKINDDNLMKNVFILSDHS